MRNYETAFLLAPNLPEEETEQLIEQMAEIVKSKKGKIFQNLRSIYHLSQV